MCFAPQRRAPVRHPNLQKWSGPSVLCTFWLGNVLRATTACNFSSLIWSDGSAPAALASLLFDPLEPQIIGKTQFFATFLPFRAPASSFFWRFLFSDLLSSALLFSILLLHLCFSSVHIVGSLTSKRPSINLYNSLKCVKHVFQKSFIRCIPWLSPCRAAVRLGTARWRAVQTFASALAPLERNRRKPGAKKQGHLSRQKTSTFLSFMIFMALLSQTFFSKYFNFVSLCLNHRSSQ